MQQVGINAKVVYLGWGAVYDRILFAPKDIWGKTYDDGGFDALFIGFNLLVIPNMITAYGRGTGAEAEKFFPPGPNFYYYENSQYTQMLDKYLRDTPVGFTADRIQTLKNMQAYMQTNGPDYIIEFDKGVSAVSPQIKGFDPVYNYYLPSFLSGPSTTTAAVPGEWTAFNPVLSSSWYDLPYLNAMFEGATNFNSQGQVYPIDLAKYPLTSPDGLHWELNLRPGVMWHDGVEVTADDYLYQMWTQYTPATGSLSLGYFTTVFGSKLNLTWLNGTTTTIDQTTPGDTPTVGTAVAKDKYTLDITLPQVYAIFDPESLFGPLPKHVLESIAPADWATSSFNTGQGNYTIHRPDGSTVQWVGPVGNGPYQFVGFDRVKQIVTVKKFAQYWNTTGLQSEHLYNIDTWQTQFITDKESALAALKNGEVQMLDYNYHYQKDISRFDPSWGVTQIFNAFGLQEMGLNMRHPVFGTGTDTPLGKKDPTQAAAAAMHVRRAIDYLIPRELIIKNLLDGIGSPGTTIVAPPQVGFNDALTATPYDINAAKTELSAAGYDVSGFTSANLSASASLTDVTLNGQFLNASSGKPFAFPLVVTIQMSTDGSTWSNVKNSTGGDMQVFANPDGTFTATVPNAPGPGNVWFRAYYPGNTIPIDEWVKIVGTRKGVLWPVELTQLVPPLTTAPVQVFVLGTTGIIGIVVLLVAIVGGAVFYFARRKGKAKPKQ
jgi:ABC-type transport system substrate-binding protein